MGNVSASYFAKSETRCTLSGSGRSVFGTTACYGSGAGAGCVSSSAAGDVHVSFH